MPIKPVKAALEVLAHDSRLDRPASETISYLMDLLYYGDFRIFQQVASADDHDYVNLIGTKGPSQGKKPLWLISTVATGQLPAPSRWERTNGNPFNPTIDEELGLLYGMGASSGKVDFICKLLAASTVGREELNRPLYVIGLLGEEARSTGLGSVLDLSGGEGGYALIGAPTNLELCRTHPGLVSLRIRLNREVRHRRMPPIRGIFRLAVSGRSAHAQWPGLATNALERGFQVLKTLKQQGDIRILSVSTDRGANRIPGSCELIIATTYDNLPHLPTDVTIESLGDGVSVPFPVDGLIAFWERGKRAVEKAFKETSLLGEGCVIPAERRVHFGELVSDRDSLSGTLTFWTGDVTDPMGIAAQVAECFQQAPRKGDLIDVEIQVIQDRPHFEAATEKSPFLEGAQAILQDQGLAPITSKGIVTTDAGLLQQEGIETLVFGPGSTGASLYRDNESIPLRHIEACYRFYVELIRRLCLK